jgi:hypothetical protein
MRPNDCDAPCDDDRRNPAADRYNLTDAEVRALAAIRGAPDACPKAKWLAARGVDEETLNELGRKGWLERWTLGRTTRWTFTPLGQYRMGLVLVERPKRSKEPLDDTGEPVASQAHLCQDCSGNFVRYLAGPRAIRN